MVCCVPLQSIYYFFITAYVGSFLVLSNARNKWFEIGVFVHNNTQHSLSIISSRIIT